MGTQHSDIKNYQTEQHSNHVQLSEFRRPNSEKSFLSNLVSGKTPAVKNIEAAYSRAGATNNHTPGAASQLGSQDQKSGASEHQGVGSAKFEEGISDQRQEPSII